MNNTNYFYDYLDDLPINQDGSFNYNITKRILEKYQQNEKIKKISRMPISILNTNRKEAA